MHKGESCVDPAILGKGFWINSTTVANFRRFQEKEQMESVCKRKLICSQKKWRIQCLHQHTIIGVALKQANWYFFHRQKFVNDLAIHEFHMKRLSLQSTFLNVLKEKEREREKGKNQLAKQLISTFSMIYRKKKGDTLLDPWKLLAEAVIHSNEWHLQGHMLAYNYIYSL